MKKILLTGANGFVGYYLIEQLLAANYSIIATGTGPNRLPYQSPTFTYEEMDITSPPSINSVFAKHTPDIVVHSAAISKPDECELNREKAYKINVQGTINLLKEANQYGCYFLFLSTDFVFDGIKGMYREDDLLDPVNYYGETKSLAEEAVKAYKGNNAIVRTVLVYGTSYSGRDNIVTSVAKALQKGEKLSIYDDQVRTPTLVTDLAAGITAMVCQEATGIFHICGRDIRTPYQIACDVAEMLGLDKGLIAPVTRSSFQQPALRPLKTGLDISKAETELNYKPTPFEEGLRRTLKAFSSSSAH